MQKNEEWKEIGETLQEDFQHNQMRFWAKIRARTKGNNEVGRVCDKSGQVLCDEKEVRKRWREYFASLLQDEEVQQNVHRNARGEDEQVEMAGHERISIEEVCSSIWRLKNGKAPGVWGVTGEMLKAGGQTVVQWLHKNIDLGMFQWTGGSISQFFGSLGTGQLLGYPKNFTWPCATAAQLQGVEPHCQSLLLKSAEI